ncbi:MAG: DUF3131 domain-containing protein [Streptococcaceae bacterium]|nr:DUF3131 domain-containing protein [Streptococcaceae bacterium]
MIKSSPVSKAMAQKTWNYFVKATQTPTGLPSDRIDINPDGSQTMVTQTNDSNIGMYLTSIISAQDLGIISQQEATNRVQALIKELRALPKYQGFFYDWYNTNTGAPNEKFVSTVDVAWLDTALITAEYAFPKLKSQLSSLSQAMDYSLLYNQSLNQLYGGYTVGTGPTGFTYGNINTETRIADYLAIGKGNVPAKLWFGVYRTLPSNWTWQQQVPAGYSTTYAGTKVFEGHYTYEGITYVPSWGGSMFEALMPTLFMNEKALAPRALGLNDYNMVQLQVKYAQTQKYSLWGISPCATPDGGYDAFGIKEVGSANPPYDETGVITPHASFLALQFAPQQAQANLTKMATEYDMVGKYGFYDSINPKTATVTHSYLALDEGMIMASLDNALDNNALMNDFNQSSIARIPQPLLSMEKFSITAAPKTKTN